MPRLFVGIDLPDEIDEQLELMHGGVPGARWEGREKLHVTVRFVGDVDGGTLRAAVDALAAIEHERFAVELAGVGTFPPRGKPRVLWIGVADPEPLKALRRKVDRALAGLDLDPDRRKYAPHVTLARIKNGSSGRTAEFLAHHALFRADPFEVEAFQLYSSVLSPRGSKYRIEAAFPLEPANSSGTGQDPRVG
jgi:2'-5' RNA ligase